jgi:hypothetical protein
MRWQPTPGLSLFGTFFTSFALNGRLGPGCGHTLAIKQMTGRYQSYHYFPSKIGSIEIYWRADGWWWRSRSSGRPPEGARWAIHNEHGSLSQRERGVLC